MPHGALFAVGAYLMVSAISAVGNFWVALIVAPLGVALRAVTRLPYLSGGDVQHPAYVLDAALLVCEKP